ncbi:MAG: Na+/H+ antiporter NhaA [Actinobacteria bacterium]|nr:Na+/H+ antiporter NhaA [Actinomycetota bacterium]
MPRRLLSPLAEFLRTEIAGGVALLVAATTALVWANVDPASYADTWHSEITIGGTTLDVTHWVNEGLMAVFFFVVGLEIKRELVEGELRDRRAATLPVVAALGGMLMPAALYLTLNAGRAGSEGWGIPMATDIAFAMGVLALLGTRAPAQLKLLLLTLAIVDDLGAIVVIAIFYSGTIALSWIGGAIGVSVAMLLMRRLRFVSPWWYLVPAVALWWCVLQSGIHATIAGVALGLLTPTRDARNRDPLTTLERGLHPWSSFLIVPLFALANAGMIIDATTAGRALESRITWGVIAGLVVGKVLGITTAAWAACRLGLASLPGGLGARHVVGLGLLGGIGFTVSLFVADLAFAGIQLQEAKLGVLAASLASGAVAIVVLGMGEEPSRAVEVPADRSPHA